MHGLQCHILREVVFLSGCDLQRHGLGEVVFLSGCDLQRYGLRDVTLLRRCGSAQRYGLRDVTLLRRCGSAQPTASVQLRPLLSPSNAGGAAGPSSCPLLLKWLHQIMRYVPLMAHAAQTFLEHMLTRDS